MNDSKYRSILYLILVMILSTIGIQTYWNYNNYLTSKQQLINDVQVSLDNAVDTYYTNLAQSRALGFSWHGASPADLLNNGKFDSILEVIDITENKNFFELDSIKPSSIKGITMFRGAKVDSLLSSMSMHGETVSERKPNPKTHMAIELKEKDPEANSLFTSKVVISLSTDHVSLKSIDKLLQSELNRKRIDIKYLVKYINPKLTTNYFDSESGEVNSVDSVTLNSYLQTSSKSAFLPKKSELKIAFHNTSKDIFKRIIVGLLISTVLVLAVISCLFYLLHIIKQQKQLAEVKNDLISNITHEFKTPISTIGVALEGLKNFNALDDKVKTHNYLNISNDQLSKLNVMVEKLLETATLDSDNLELHKEQVNVTDLVQQLVDKYTMQNQTHEIDVDYSPHTIVINADPFHIENALNNVIDNAIKYGGSNIKIAMNQNASITTISISDSGNSLKSINREKIFEKFYRVSKGNTHDVKGFGIGLYYTKKIIQKHGGDIVLKLENNRTTFKIALPND